nr:MAG TPA: hypothetical protein [Caudoviricetes sp.]
MIILIFLICNNFLIQHKSRYVELQRLPDARHGLSRPAPVGKELRSPPALGSSRAAGHQKEAGRGFDSGRGDPPRLSAPLRILKRRFSAFRPFYTLLHFLALFLPFYI